MEIPMYKAKPAIDFMRFMDGLEKKYNFDHRDCASKYKWIAERRDELCKEWGIDYNVWGKIKPSDMNEREKQFYEVYKAEVTDEKKQPPYQDFWHWLLDNDFVELHRGGFNNISFWNLEEGNTPDWVKKVLQLILDEVKDNPAFDGEELNCYVDW
jgi:hypothetical protein